MAEKLYQRVNLRLKEETYDVYKAAADGLGMEVTPLIRKVVEAQMPLMQALAQAGQAVGEGRTAAAAGLFIAVMQKVMADGELGLAQARELERSEREKDLAAVAGAGLSGPAAAAAE